MPISLTRKEALDQVTQKSVRPIGEVTCRPTACRLVLGTFPGFTSHPKVCCVSPISLEYGVDKRVPPSHCLIGIEEAQVWSAGA